MRQKNPAIKDFKKFAKPGKVGFLSSLITKFQNIKHSRTPNLFTKSATANQKQSKNKNNQWEKKTRIKDTEKKR